MGLVERVTEGGMMWRLKVQVVEGMMELQVAGERRLGMVWSTRVNGLTPCYLSDGGGVG